MFKMFNMFNSFGMFGSSNKKNTYNPLINYDWSTTTTSGLRYLKDVGSTPTYNASMYFGRGAYLNGVDQTITVPINTTIQTSLKRVNGVVTINETSQALTNYVISGLGVHKDYYLFTRLLTTAEKDSYIATPELFYAMAQADSTCVLNMPMSETDGYVRNMKSYSETSVVNEEMDNFSNFTNFASQSTLSSSGGILTHISLAAYAKIYIRQNLVANTTYKIEVDLTEASSMFEVKCSYTGADDFTWGRINSSTPTKIVLFVKPTTSGSAFITLQNSVSGKTLKYNYLRVTAVTRTYPITNYTSSVRDNAKNLQYGLQTCKFVRDNAGVIQSASDYLECDGTGYADTGWIPSVSEDWTITVFFNNNMNSTMEIFGVYGDNTENRMYIQKHSNNSVRAYVGNTGSGYIYSGAGLTKVTITYKASTKSGKFIINKTNIIPYTNLNFLGCISPFYLGVSSRNNSSFNTYYYTGSNYKFRLDNKVLTDDEIQIIRSEGI